MENNKQHTRVSRRLLQEKKHGKSLKNSLIKLSLLTLILIAILYSTYDKWSMTVTGEYSQQHEEVNGNKVEGENQNERNEDDSSSSKDVSDTADSNANYELDEQESNKEQSNENESALNDDSKNDENDKENDLEDSENMQDQDKDKSDEQTSSKQEESSSSDDTTETNNNGEESNNFFIHTVKKSDTLYKISMHYYNSSEEIEKIRELNQIKGDAIYIGQKLKMPIKK
jgi:LysM repeat protein